MAIHFGFHSRKAFLSSISARELQELRVVHGLMPFGPEVEDLRWAALLGFSAKHFSKSVDLERFRFLRKPRKPQTADDMCRILERASRQAEYAEKHNKQQAK